MGDVVSISSRVLPPGGRRPMRRGVSATAHYERGLALEATAPDAALAAYARAIAGRPDLADAWNNAGRLLHDRGDLAGAESSYRLAICADPTVALYWFNLGVAIEDAGAGAGGSRRGEAIAAYERALELDPMRADAHFNVARQYEQGARGPVASSAGAIWAQRAVRHYLRYRQLERRHQPIFK